MSNLLSVPSNWSSLGSGPPLLWNGTSFANASLAVATTINLLQIAGASGNEVTGVATYTDTDGAVDTWYLCYGFPGSAISAWITLVNGASVPFSFNSLGAETGPSLFLSTTLPGSESTPLPTIYYSGVLTITPPYNDIYNCDCDCGYPSETLAQIRAKVASLMGYSAQIAALPASVQLAILTNLNMQQRLVVTDVSEIQNTRYFSWPVAVGETKFCPTENQETCRNLLMATKISEAYFVGAGNVITRLTKGIPFQLYEAANPSSIPSRYDVRSCIEIWPPPVAAGTLVVKGTLAAVDLVNDSDKVMVDPTALLMRTVAFMKSSKGHEDAGNYSGQYWDYIGNLVADTHTDERYIPGWCMRDPRFEERLTNNMEPRTYGP